LGIEFIPPNVPPAAAEVKGREVGEGGVEVKDEGAGDERGGEEIRRHWVRRGVLRGGGGRGGQMCLCSCRCLCAG
jgi:hypothetical protein